MNQGSGPQELPKDRIGTADERGRRVWLYVADVRGRLRDLRTQISVVLVVFFLVLPWIRIGGNPAILLDIPGRRFSILGVLFWAHDGPMVVFLLGGGLLALAFLTAILGRVWCGYACPQTVFVDLFFRRIERWVEGNPVERKRLDRAPWSFAKLQKKSLKWGLYLLLSVVISHSFLAYFVGANQLAVMIRTSPFENPTTFLFMLGFTGLILFDFGWFREQFCVIACPYGRFQSVLMDQDSMVVAYDQKRGEPRRGVGPKGGPQGDCVSCNRCVDVCPTGIDIRRGVQMECIACTSCMDACDEVMVKFDKQKGLIKYGSLAVAQAGSAEAKFKPRFGIRGWIYFGLMLVFAGGLAYTVSARTAASIFFTRAVGAPYQLVERAGAESEVVNQFRVDLQNQTFEDLQITLELEAAESARGVSIVRSANAPSLASGQNERSNLFVRLPKAALAGGHGNVWLRVVAKNPQGSEVMNQPRELKLVGPY